QKKQKQEVEALIQEENLNEESAKRYIMTSLKREYASDNGNDLNAALPKMSPLNPAYHTKKETVFKKIGELVEKFKGIGGEL
ncbi:type I restriction endonuclease subunit R, EcoR124 family, partial [Streptococcus sobrinus]